MKKILFLLFLLIAGLWGGSSPLWAAGRDSLFYQGFLVDPQGNPISGGFAVTYRFYDSDAGGAPLWEETQNNTFDRGVFLAELGTVEPFPEDLFDFSSLYLSLQIEGDDELSPRLPLYSVPWSKQADVADVALSLANDVVTGDSIAPGSISGADIQAGSIGAAELSNTGVTPGVYNLATITVAADGRLTAAANGA